ncbi:MAG TPA: hypothetical protein VJ419_03205, partial [Gaiellaceae bacterium]|nr:hypothetical protein [Gaiellaceae bacterium]
ERHAPIVRIVEQTEECGHGEPFIPTDVDLLFGDPTVALRGPWNRTDLVKIAPSAKDLVGRYEYHLDFPGDPLNAGCDYEKWARRLTKSSQPTVYAHVATDPAYPGELALQYWFFYPFNDFNNTHEGDWEMIQLVFDASTAEEALGTKPVEVGYSQHEGAERAEWGDDKLELVGSSHPVVHPADGSHANFYGEALYLGSSASEGVGCDDTRGPTFDVRPAVQTIPSAQSEAMREFPWIGFPGRWGEQRPAFFNGPTGPNVKDQWMHPIEWSQDWRDRSYTVPGSTIFGHSATEFFCGAVAHGSTALVRLVDHPLGFGVAVAGLALIVLILVARATWRPTAPLRLAHRRAWGQILAASARMYVRRITLFLGIGVLFVPVSLLIALLQVLVLHATSIFGLQTGGVSSGPAAFVALVIGTSLTLLGLGLVQAATARALVELDRGANVSALGAYRLALDSVVPLFGALLAAVLAVSLLASTFYLLPIAIWLAGRWALVVPVVELEEASALDALRRSRELVRGRWLKVASLIVAGGAVVLALGPLLGALLILVTNAPFWLVNVVAGVVYAVTMPIVALATAYAYFDARVRVELEGEHHPVELPAEIGLSA